MSTNYYFFGSPETDGKRVHIGKMTSAGGGRLRFTWALDPIKTMERLEGVMYVVDCDGDVHEGDQIRAGKLLDELRICEHDYSQVGQEFT